MAEERRLPMSWDGRDKRKFTRVYLPCRIIVHPPKEDIIDVVTNNISEGGAGFSLKQKLKVSSVVGLEIYNIRRRPITCEGIIKWVNEIESTRVKGTFIYNTGIEFYNIRPKDRLAIINLIASIPKSKK